MQCRSKTRPLQACSQELKHHGTLCVCLSSPCRFFFFPNGFLTQLRRPAFSARHSWGRAFPAVTKFPRHRHGPLCQLTGRLSGAESTLR